MDPSISDKEDQFEAHYARIESLLSAKLEQHQYALEKIIVSIFEVAGSYTSALSMHEGGLDCDEKVPQNCVVEGSEQFDSPAALKQVESADEDKIVTFNDKGTPVEPAQKQIIDYRPKEVGNQPEEKPSDWWSSMMAEMGRLTHSCCRRRCHLEAVEKLEDSALFDNIACITILASSIYIGYTTDFEIKTAAWHWKNGSSTDNLEPASAFGVELVFTIWFTFELTIRLLAWQGEFFTHDERIWNCVDFFLVITAIVDLSFQSLGFDFKQIRMMRLLRILRGTRTIRMLRFFRTFRILLMEFMGAMVPFMWACIFISIVTFIFAVCILQGVSFWVGDASNHGSQTTTDLMKYFANLPLTLLSLYMAATGGVSWMELAFPLLEVHLLYCGLCMLYVTLMMLVAFNIITATFVSEVEDILDDEEERLNEEEMKKKNEMIAKYQALFEQLDCNQSGMISRDEFDCAAHHDEMSAFFAESGIDATDVSQIFNMLDEDGTGEIEMNEFIVGCFTLRDMPKPITMHALMRENKRVVKKFEHFLEHFENGIRQDIKNISYSLSKPSGKAMALKAPGDLSKRARNRADEKLEVPRMTTSPSHKIAAPAPVAAAVQKRPKMKKANTFAGIETE